MWVVATKVVVVEVLCVVLCEFFGLPVPFIYFGPKKGRISEGKKLRTEGFIG